MAELIARVSEYEAVKAAVAEGADAVILVFSREKMAVPSIGSDVKELCDYCHARDVRLYISAELFPHDSEFMHALNYAKTCWKSGADGVVASDIGLIKAISEAIPDMPVHAGTKTAVFNVDDVRILAAMGCKRVYLPKELTLEEVARISSLRIEACVLVQGDMCSSVDGFCLLSMYYDGVREDRDICTRPCKKAFRVIQNRNEHPLSIKDCGLIKHVGELVDANVTGIVINGMGREPEYTAIVTKIYREALNSPDMTVGYDMVNALSRAKQGVESTDRFLTGKKGELMTGGADYDGDENPLYEMIRDEYSRKEYPRIPVDYVVILKNGETAKLAVRDDRGNIVTIEGAVPRTEGSFEARRSMVVRQCRMSDNSPFRCLSVKTVIDENVFFSARDMEKLVTKALNELEKKRYVRESRHFSDYTMHSYEGRTELPVYTFSVLKQNQLSSELYALRPRVLYIPIEELKTVTPELKPFIEDSGITVCAVLPRVIKNNETEKISAMLKIIRSYGVNGLCVSSLGQALLGRGFGFDIHGDFGLNVVNGEMMNVIGKLGLSSAMLSPILTETELRNISKPIDTEVAVYGRLPLMYTENCILKNNAGFCLCDKPEKFTDIDGNTLSISGDFGCRNTVYSGKKLFLSQGDSYINSCGIWGKRICFTTENANECVMIAKRYIGIGNYVPAETFHGFTIENTEE